MDIAGSRFLVAGATGVIGGKLASELSGRGASLVLAGRDEARLAALGEELDCPTVVLDYSDPESVAHAVDRACEELGGLDGLVVATGAVAFGEARELDPEVLTRLIEANASGPIHLITESLRRIEPGDLPGDVFRGAPAFGQAGLTAGAVAVGAAPHGPVGSGGREQGREGGEEEEAFHRCPNAGRPFKMSCSGQIERMPAGAGLCLRTYRPPLPAHVLPRPPCHSMLPGERAHQPLSRGAV